MESFINEIITSELEDVHSVSYTAEEVLLNRRISPYATLRPGDLAALVKLQRSHLLHHPAAHRPAPRCGSVFLEDSEEEGEEQQLQSQPAEDVVMRGSEHGHVPAEYTVKGIRRHEMPVIGVCVDSRVVPGFRYKVRRLGTGGSNNTNDLLWGGKARTLQSVGMGYGSRLTFQDDTLNNNECYFWSDSEPLGFGFSIHAVDEGQNFLIQDQTGVVLGEAQIETIHEPQEESSMTATKGRVSKQVAVNMTCRVTYYHKHHYGLMDLMSSEDTETVSGHAVLLRSRPGVKASLQAIEGIFLPRLGDCKFVPDNC